MFLHIHLLTSTDDAVDKPRGKNTSAMEKRNQDFDPRRAMPHHGGYLLRRSNAKAAMPATIIRPLAGSGETHMSAS